MIPPEALASRSVLVSHVRCIMDGLELRLPDRAAEPALVNWPRENSFGNVRYPLRERAREPMAFRIGCRWTLLLSPDADADDSSGSIQSHSSVLRADGQSFVPLRNLGHSATAVFRYEGGATITYPCQSQVFRPVCRVRMVTSAI
jgi:hypothetical protein